VATVGTGGGEGQLVYEIVQPLSKQFRPPPGEGWKNFPPPQGFQDLFLLVPISGADEYGDPGEELRELYEAAGGMPVIEPYQVAFAGTSRLVYFVGPQTDLASSAHKAHRDLAFYALDMEEWLGRWGGESQDPCGFAEIFRGYELPRTLKSWKSIDAWWVMDDHFMFTLDPMVAETLLAAILLEADKHGSWG
jgi:hypothetical protein